jgi:hypothetical protein
VVVVAWGSGMAAIAVMEVVVTIVSVTVVLVVGDNDGGNLGH